MESQIWGALGHKLITEPMLLVSEYSFYVGELSPRVTIRIYLRPDGTFCWQQSHYMHTPVQAGPYMTSRAWRDTEELALGGAVEALTDFYEEAVRRGHEPEDSWLVANETFRDADTA